MQELLLKMGGGRLRGGGRIRGILRYIPITDITKGVSSGERACNALRHLNPNCYKV